MDHLQAAGADSRLPHYAGRLRRHWWAAPVALLLGISLGYGLTVAQPDVYSSQTSVLVLPTFPAQEFSSAGGRTGSAIDLDTEAQLVRSAQVAEGASARLGGSESTSDLLDRVSVTVPDSSQVLAVAFSASTPEQAQRGAAAFAEAYLALRTADAQAELDTTEKVLTAQVADLSAKLKDTTEGAAKLPQNSAARAFAEAQRGILISQINDINGRLIPLKATAVNPGQIIAAATLPPAAGSLIPPLNLAVGLLAGILVALGLVWLADRLNHRVRRAGDLARFVDVPVLADVAVGSAKGVGGLPGDAHAATFDLMRNDVLGAAEGLRLFQVAGEPAAGATGVTAVQFARSLARRTGRPSLLVVGSTVARTTDWAGVRGQAGLVQVLRGEASLDEVAVTLPGGDVRVLGPGRHPEALEQLLQSPALATLLRTLADGDDPVVVETAGIETSAGAQTVAAACDRVVLVAQSRLTDGRHLRVAVQEAGHMGAPVAGVVLVRLGDGDLDAGEAGAPTGPGAGHQVPGATEAGEPDAAAKPAALAGARPQAAARTRTA